MNNSIKRSFILVSLIVSVVFLSGCVIPSAPSVPITVNQKNQNDNTADILIVQNEATYPSQPIYPNSKFTFSFDVKNVHNSAVAKCLHVRLYDKSIFKFQSNNPNNNDKTVSSDCTGAEKEISDDVVNKGNVYPGASKRIIFNLISPSADEIGNLKITPTISYRFTYDFTANTIYQIVIVDGQYLATLQQAGKSVTANPINSIGPGPFKVHMNLLNRDHFVLSGSTGQLEVKIKNEGQGESSSNWGGSIDKNSLILGIPEEIYSNNMYKGVEGNFGEIACPDDYGSNYKCITNKDKINLYQGSSAPLILRFEAPKINNKGSKVPYKIYTFRATMNYQYLMDRSYSIEVNPHEIQ